MSADDLARIEGEGGAQVALFAYLGGKHMVTGYDHLLFLVGVMYLLARPARVLTLATLFAIGHSVTLLSGVMFALDVNPYLIDALIGLSVAYKGYDNLGGWQRKLGWQPHEGGMVFAFGTIHGLGLATKLQEFELSGDGLLQNLVAFNVGVELGQILALSLILVGLGWLRYFNYAEVLRVPINAVLVLAGMLLAAYQFAMWMV